MSILNAKEHHMGDVLYRSWISWLDLLDGRKELDESFSVVFTDATLTQMKALLEKWRERTALKQKMTVAMARWRNATLAPSFLSWVSHVQEVQGLRYKLRGALVKLAQKELLGAWNKWVEYVVMQQKVRRAASKWYNKALADAWDRWRDWLGERITAYDRLNRAMSFWKNKAIVSFWVHWIHIIVEIQERRAKLLGALAKMSQRQIAAAWNKWMEVVLLQNEMRAKLAGALQRMSQRELAAAWNTWQLRVLEAKAAARAASALKHWANRHLSSAFRAWKERLEVLQSNARAKELALAYWIHGTMRNWWERWQDYVSDCMKEKAAEIYSLQSLNKSVFKAWRFRVQNETRPQNDLKDFSVAFGEMKLKQRFFKEWVHTSEHGSLARTGVFFHSRRSLIRGFEAWKVFTLRTTEERVFKSRLEALLGIGDAYSNFRRYASPKAY